MSSSREKILLFFVIVSVIGAGGFLGVSWGIEWWEGVEGSIQTRKDEIEYLQTLKSQKGWMKERFDRVQADLHLEGTSSDQKAVMKNELNQLFATAQLVPKGMTDMNPRDEEDFRVLLVQVEDIQGTSKQLADFLYRLENQSAVLFVETMRINNPTNLGRGDNAGMLNASFRIARLVEYATGETPPSKRARTSRITGD